MTRVLLGASRAARWCAAAAWCIVAFTVMSPAIRRAVLGGPPERRAAALTFIATLLAVAAGSRRLGRDSLRRVLPDVLVVAGPLVLLLVLLAGGLGSSGIVVAALWLVGAGALVSGWRSLAAAAVVLAIVAIAERQARGEVALPDIMFAAPLLAAAALAPGFLRGTPQPQVRANRAPAGERRRALMLTGDQKAVGGEPAPEPGSPSADPSAELEGDVTTLEDYLEDVRLALGAEEAVAWRWSESSGEMRVVAWASADGGELRFPAAEGAPLIEWASREGFVVTDDAAQPRIVAAPIARADRLYGALGLYAANGLACGRAEAKSASGRFAAHVGALLELFETRRRAVTVGARSQALLRAAETLQRNLDPAALSEGICASALAVTGASRAAFVSWDAERDTGRVERSTEARWVTDGTAVASGSLVALVCRERRRLVMENLESVPAPGVSVFGVGRQQRSPGSLAVVPVMLGGLAAGAIVVEGDYPGQVRTPEGEGLTLLATIAALSIEVSDRLAAASARASTDSLTGLANRRVFDERLEQLLAESERYGQPVSLVLADIDHFKLINDTHGHDTGDEVLRQVARAISNSVRGIDLAARYGGEEIAVLLPHTTLAGARDVAERLRERLCAEPVVAGQARIRVTASFGVACFPDGVRSRGALFAAADRALYTAKAEGRNRVSYWPQVPAGL